MKVLVTGADGYIGTRVGPVLIGRGHDVIGLDTGLYRDGCFYEDPAAQRLPVVGKDVRHITAEDLKGFDALVHLAELSNDPVGQHNPHITYQINHRGSVNLAKVCKQAGVARFVYSSSCSVYGIGDGEFMTEESASRPQTAYAECKVLVERDVAALADDNFSPTFLRNATAYGPSPRMRFDLVLNNLAGSAWTAGEIRMTSDGTPWRPLVHVLDICEAIAQTLEAPREVVSNQILNVGDTSENYRIRDIAEIVASAFHGCRITLGSPSGDHRSYRVSFEKIRTILPGFCCQRTAVKGALELRELFEKIGMSKEMFEFRGFTRVKQLEYLRDSRLIDGDFHWTLARGATAG